MKQNVKKIIFLFVTLFYITMVVTAQRRTIVANIVYLGDKMLSAKTMSMAIEELAKEKFEELYVIDKVVFYEKKVNDDEIIYCLLLPQEKNPSYVNKIKFHTYSLATGELKRILSNNGYSSFPSRKNFYVKRNHCIEVGDVPINTEADKALFLITTAIEETNYLFYLKENDDLNSLYYDKESININTPPTLKTRIDSLSFFVGMAQSEGMREYISGKLGVDLNCLNHFTRGLISQQNIATLPQQKKAYESGKAIGEGIIKSVIPGLNKEIFGKESNQSISKNLFYSGFVCGYTERNGVTTIQKSKDIALSLMTACKTEQAMKKYAYNKNAGERFLASNARTSGVRTLASGVQYKIIKKGTGPIPTKSQFVTVHYKGQTIDGKEFDNSYERGNPATFRCDQVIKGWTDALVHMQVGSIWEVYIPQELAYGEHEQGEYIKPFSVLIFTIELLGVDSIDESQK